MRFVSGIHGAALLVICLMLIAIPACSLAQATPVTQIVEVTRIVPVTRLVEATPVEVTRIILAAPMVVVTQEVEAPPVEVTRLVFVTQIVPVTRIVQITQLVEVPPPAPAPLAVPAPTQVPPPLPVPVPTPVIPFVNEALLTWYDFEDDFLTSGVIADRSGNGYDAQIYGPVAAAEGVSGGQAMFFSGDGYIQAQSNPAAGRRTVSFSLWFKTDHPEANYKLASAAWWNGGPGSGWILATHMPEFWSDDTQSLFFPGITVQENYFPIGEWVHEVVTYDGSRIREYTNGQLVNDWPTTGAALGQGQAMAVGAWPQFSGFNFQGSLDEFQLFGWTLSAQEVQAIYHQGQ